MKRVVPPIRTPIPCTAAGVNARAVECVEAISNDMYEMDGIRLAERRHATHHAGTIMTLIASPL